VLRIADLDHRVDVGTAAEAPVAEDALEAVEVAEELLARRRVGGRHELEARREIRGDQRVLGPVVVVEGPLADAGLGRDGVDADRTNALRVEQLVRGGEDALGWGLGVHRSV